MKTKLLTRREIINVWLETAQWLDHPCCPICRNILIKLPNEKYTCEGTLLGCGDKTEYDWS